MGCVFGLIVCAIDGICLKFDLGLSGLFNLLYLLMFDLGLSRLLMFDFGLKLRKERGERKQYVIKREKKMNI